MIGYGLLTGIVAGGIGGPLGRSALLHTSLTTVGAGYLLSLGVTVLRRPGTHLTGADPPSVPTSTRSSVLRGIGVSGLNPKGILIFVSMLPQFTDIHRPWPLPLQLALLGLVYVLTCGAFYTAIGLGARAILATKPATSRLISRVAAAAMIVVGRSRRAHIARRPSRNVALPR